jgi:hypothetical protein
MYSPVTFFSKIDRNGSIQLFFSNVLRLRRVDLIGPQSMSAPALSEIFLNPPNHGLEAGLCLRSVDL